MFLYDKKIFSSVSSTVRLLDVGAECKTLKYHFHIRKLFFFHTKSEKEESLITVGTKNNHYDFIYYFTLKTAKNDKRSLDRTFLTALSD